MCKWCKPIENSRTDTMSHCEDVSKFWPTKGEAITLFDTVKAVIAALSENLSALTPVPRRRNPVFCCRKDRIDPSPGQSLLSPIPSWEWGEKSYLKALTIFLIVALLFLLLTLAGKWCVTVKSLSVQDCSSLKCNDHYTTYCFRLRSMTTIKVKYSNYSKSRKWC